MTPTPLVPSGEIAGRLAGRGAEEKPDGLRERRRHEYGVKLCGVWFKTQAWKQGVKLCGLWLKTKAA